MSEEAIRALTIHELDEASKMGLQTVACRICKRPTLYKHTKERPVPPLTCGRMPCLREAGEVLGKR